MHRRGGGRGEVGGWGGGAKEGERVNNSNSMLLHVHGDHKDYSKSHSTFTQILSSGVDNSFIALYIYK